MNVEPLPNLEQQHAALRSQARKQLDRGLLSGATTRDKARAAYLAICFDFAPELNERHPDRWAEAVHALSAYPQVLQVLFFESPMPAGDAIRQKALAAGLHRP